MEQRGLLKGRVYYINVWTVLLRHYSWRTILSARPTQQRIPIHRQALMGTLPKNVHIMWESHSSRSYNALAASLSATFRVYRTISCASGLFNVVIQAEHNCVPPSDRRLRTSSLRTKKGGKKSPPHRGEARLTSGKKSFSVRLLLLSLHVFPLLLHCLLFYSSFSTGSQKKKGSKDNGCLITM